MSANPERSGEANARRDADSPDRPTRRGALRLLGLALGGLVTAGVALPGLGFVIAPVLRKSPRRWRDVGAADHFTVGETVLVSYQDPSPRPWAGVSAKTAAWLRRDTEGAFVAFSINCTHLGCPVRWEKGAQLFLCPCHGGVYYRDGSVAAGPPPESLRRYPVRLRKGRVEIRTSPIPIT